MTCDHLYTYSPSQPMCEGVIDYICTKCNHGRRVFLTIRKPLFTDKDLDNII